MAAWLPPRTPGRRPPNSPSPPGPRAAGAARAPERAQGSPARLPASTPHRRETGRRSEAGAGPKLPNRQPAFEPGCPQVARPPSRVSRAPSVMQPRSGPDGRVSPPTTAPPRLTPAPAGAPLTPVRPQQSHRASPARAPSPEPRASSGSPRGTAPCSAAGRRPAWEPGAATPRPRAVGGHRRKGHEPPWLRRPSLHCAAPAAPVSRRAWATHRAALPSPARRWRPLAAPGGTAPSGAGGTGCRGQD